MFDRYDKHKSRANRALNRLLFMREWDPIGVSDLPQAQDEYDAYVAKAYVMLIDDCATVDELEAYLVDVEANHMGLGMRESTRERCRRTAEQLLSLLPSLIL